jgi:hypothetical protein
MTPDEWDDSHDPQPMLQFLQRAGGLTDRKARLFAVAVARRIWHLLTDARSRRSVEVAERFADGQALGEELSDAAAEAQGAGSDPAGAAFAAWATAGGFTTVAAAAAWAAREAAEAAAGIPHTPTDADPWAVTHLQEFAARKAAWQTERSQQAALLRCIAGDPFRPLPPLNTPLLTGDNGLLPRLAQAAYEDRKLPEGTLDNDRLAVLADALEEAGCTDDELLGHLRSPGPHVRGCFALDAVLGRS